MPGNPASNRTAQGNTIDASVAFKNTQLGQLAVQINAAKLDQVASTIKIVSNTIAIACLYQNVNITTALWENLR